MKFRIERAGSANMPPIKRGPKPKIAEYHKIPLENMEPGDGIKIAEVARTKRNSTYLSVLGVLRPRFEELGGEWRVATTLQAPGSEMVDVWITRVSAPEAPRPRKRRK